MDRRLKRRTMTRRQIKIPCNKFKNQKYSLLIFRTISSTCSSISSRRCTSNVLAPCVTEAPPLDAVELPPTAVPEFCADAAAVCFRRRPVAVEPPRPLRPPRNLRPPLAVAVDGSGADSLTTTFRPLIFCSLSDAFDDRESLAAPASAARECCAAATAALVGELPAPVLFVGIAGEERTLNGVWCEAISQKIPSFFSIQRKIPDFLTVAMDTDYKKQRNPRCKLSVYETNPTFRSIPLIFSSDALSWGVSSPTVVCESVLPTSPLKTPSTFAASNFAVLRLRAQISDDDAADDTYVSWRRLSIKRMTRRRELGRQFSEDDRVYEPAAVVKSCDALAIQPATTVRPKNFDRHRRPK
uniref:Uncharacterized protein n=1 Tax=Romanomermis culicivorax TaxID=13658 RepID=A0A915IK27_ROMCU